MGISAGGTYFMTTSREDGAFIVLEFLPRYDLCFMTI